MQILSATQLLEEQRKTLESERLRPGIMAKILFSTMDAVYGKEATLNKFRVLEVVARVPYQAWEHVAYIAVTHKHETPEFARSIHERITESREQQDNEQWHLLIMEELLHARGQRSNLLKGKVIPQLLAFVYYQISWLLYAMKPRWSYELNTQFEDHAEHEYMAFVEAHPELDDEEWVSIFTDDYGKHATVGALLRQIGFDERVHKIASFEQIEQARFSSAS